MSSPATVAVDATTVTTLVDPAPQGTRRNAVILGRQDSDTNRVFVSFGTAKFTAGTAAFWLNANSPVIITPDDARWSLVNMGVYALSESGTINVNVQTV